MVINATALTMIAAARIVRKVRRSLANAHPSTTATTGLTNAYVPTLAADDTFSSHVYAVIPTIEPNTIKYPNDRNDSVVTRVISRRDHSPVMVPAINNKTPPATSAIAVACRLDEGSGACRV